jgi:hypothetical protein
MENKLNVLRKLKLLQAKCEIGFEESTPKDFLWRTYRPPFNDLRVGLFLMPYIHYSIHQTKYKDDIDIRMNKSPRYSIFYRDGLAGNKARSRLAPRRQHKN